MSSYEYKYFLPDHGEDADDACRLVSKRCVTPASDAWDIETLAEEAAQDHFDNHGGWESSWPLVIVLLTSDGEVLGKCEVEMDHSPVFNAGLVREAT